MGTGNVTTLPGGRDDYIVFEDAGHILFEIEEGALLNEYQLYSIGGLPGGIPGIIVGDIINPMPGVIRKEKVLVGSLVSSSVGRIAR